LRVFVFISHNKTLPSNDGFSISNVIQNSFEYFKDKSNINLMHYIIVSSYKKGLLNNKNYKYVKSKTIFSYLIVLLIKAIFNKELQRKYFYSIERINMQYIISLVMFTFRNISKNDIILFHGSSNALLLISLIFPNYNFIYYRHGGDVSNTGKNNIDQILQLCNGRIIHVSNSTFGQIKNKNSVVIHNGLNPTHFKQHNKERLTIRKRIREENNIKVGDLVCFMGGTIWEPKGYHIAIKALAQFNNRATVLFIAGDTLNVDQNYVNTLKELSNINNVKTIFLGCLDNNSLYEIIVASDIGMQLTIPSMYSEGISIILLEMVFLKLPVIVSTSGGNKEVIPSDEYGIIVEEKDMIKNICRGLHRYHSLEERRKVAKNAELLVYNDFNSKIMSKKLYLYLNKERNKLLRSN